MPDSAAGTTAETPTDTGATTAGDRSPSELREQTVGLLSAVHPKQAVLTAVAVGLLAAASGRSVRESVVAGLGILVVQMLLGLVNDVRDRDLDQDNLRSGLIRNKPVAEGRLTSGNATFAAVCLLLVLVPLSLQNGPVAALALLGVLAFGLLSNFWLRRTWLSWLPWAGSYALLPAYLSYGGWGLDRALDNGLGAYGAPPTISVTVLAALLGVGVHFLLSLPDLVADRRSGLNHLPLRLALHTGATPLLVVAVVLTAAMVLGLVVTGLGAGLRQ